jgi:hypothetical protein
MEEHDEHLFIGHVSTGTQATRFVFGRDYGTWDLHSMGSEDELRCCGSRTES